MFIDSAEFHTGYVYAPVKMPVILIPVWAIMITPLFRELVVRSLSPANLLGLINPEAVHVYVLSYTVKMAVMKYAYVRQQIHLYNRGAEIL